MFESEDFDLDEDFLKDIDEKEEQYYSQTNDPNSSSVEPSPKRHKSENLQSDFGDINFDDEPDFARASTKSTEKKSQENDSTRVSSRHKILPQVYEASQPHRRDKNLEMRKNLALEILRKGASAESSEAKGLSWKRSSPLQPVPSTGQRNIRIANSSPENLKEKIQETFKKPAARRSKSPAKFISIDSPKYRSAPRTTLVRKFPGPAGLLPDIPDANPNNAHFLNRLDEHKIDISENLNDSSMSEYCSQNTERLFSVGAWRAMLDDLPKNFLQGHEIASIKRKARMNCDTSENSRASFMAGVVQQVDHSVDDPRLVLKDLSDTIEATMHRDIPLAYPNVLEPGVVVLLGNVGLLGFQGSPTRPGLQFHVIIAAKNLLAIYNEKARLATSPWIESMLAEESKNLENPGVAESAMKDTRNIEETNIHSSNRIFANNSAEISDFESDEDEMAFATVDIRVVGDTQVATNFSKVASKIAGNNEKNTERNEGSKSVDETTRIRKNFETIDDVEDSSKNIEIRPKKITTVTSRLLQYRSKYVSTPSIADANNADDDKSTDDSKNQEDSSNFKSFGDDLFNSDNDTEDEILSQLDMDSIVTSYNSGI